MALDQITSQSIADNAISAGDLADGSITHAKLHTTAIQDKLGYTPVSPTQLTTEVNNLVNAAPGALNTLGELATALGNDASFATTVTNALATKANSSDVNTALATKAPLNSPTFTGDVTISSTSYLKLPIGTTAQRPASPTKGHIRINSDTNFIEYYDGSYWGDMKIYVSLYAFTSHTFTNCGSTGRYGPSLAAMQSTYSSKSWASNTAYLNSNNGTQIWTVPKTGNYQITAAGSRGGYASNAQGDNGNPPGLGVIKRATFSLNAGEKLLILVGQRGGDSPNVGPTNDPGFNSDTDGGGGGASYVAKIGGSTYYHTLLSQYCIPLIVAGGGGAGSSDGSGINASYNTTQSVSAMADQWGYSCGAGFYEVPNDTYYSGVTAKNTVRWGTTFLNGGYGGASMSATGQGLGGFGGGAGATDEGGAGGGGWFGGINSDNSSASSMGGTSYVDTSAFSVSDIGTNNDGYVDITYLG